MTPGSDRPRLRALFDGQCGLCSRMVQFLFEHEDTATFVFTPLQSEAGRILAARAAVDPDNPASFVLFDDTGAPHFKSGGTFYALHHCEQPWRTVAALARVLPRALTDRVYDFVAKRRIRVFGRTDVCAAAPEALRTRLETSPDCLT